MPKPARPKLDELKRRIYAAGQECKPSTDCIPIAARLDTVAGVYHVACMAGGTHIVPIQPGDEGPPKPLPIPPRGEKLDAGQAWREVERARQEQDKRNCRCEPGQTGDTEQSEPDHDCPVHGEDGEVERQQRGGKPDDFEERWELAGARHAEALQNAGTRELYCACDGAKANRACGGHREACYQESTRLITACMDPVTDDGLCDRVLCDHCAAFACGTHPLGTDLLDGTVE